MTAPCKRTLALSLILLFLASRVWAVDIEAEAERLRRQLALIHGQVVADYIQEQKNDVDRTLAILVIGGMYESGKFGPPDPVKAAEFYEMAVELGSPEAHYALGFICNIGAKTPTGEVVRDPARARRLFEIAADAGVAQAMTQLGIIYADGMNVDPDQKKALAYLRDAAARGESDAIRRLEPVMRKAREWEEEKPGRKANFPTSQEEILDRKLVEDRIQVEFDLQRESSRIYVEINRRIAEKVKELK